MSRRKHLPLFFYLNQRIDPRSKQLFVWLAGDLDGSPEVKKTLVALREEIRWKRPSISIIVVDSGDIRVTPEGVTDWLNFIARFRKNVQFIYLPSQLSLILDYDPRYDKYSTHIIIDENQIPAQ